MKSIADFTRNIHVLFGRKPSTRKCLAPAALVPAAQALVLIVTIPATWVWAALVFIGSVITYVVYTFYMYLTCEKDSSNVAVIILHTVASHVHGRQVTSSGDLRRDFPEYEGLGLIVELQVHGKEYTRTMKIQDRGNYLLTFSGDLGIDTPNHV